MIKKLSNGKTVDTSGPPCLIELDGQLYVAGNGWFIDVSSQDEANRVIKNIQQAPQCALEQKKL